MIQKALGTVTATLSWLIEAGGARVEGIYSCQCVDDKIRKWTRSSSQSEIRSSESI